MRVLMVIAGVPGAPLPSVRLESFVPPYYLFVDASLEVVIASSLGGDPAMTTVDGDRIGASPLLKRFAHDRVARDALADTIEIAEVEPGDFDGAFCLGAAGRLWLPERSATASALIGTMLGAGKPVAVVPILIDLAPKGLADGILIAGDTIATSLGVATALLAAMRCKAATHLRKGAEDDTEQ